MRSRVEHEVLTAVGDDPNGMATDEICRVLGKTPQELGSVFEDLKSDNRLLGFAGRWFAPGAYRDGERRFLEALETAHRQLPTALGIPADQVAEAAGLAWTGKPLDRIVAAMESAGRVSLSGAGVRATAFRPALPPRQRQFLDRVIEAIECEAINVPGPHELAIALGAPPQAIHEILRLGEQAGDLVAVAPGLYFTGRQLESLADRLRAAAKRKPFDAVTAREILGATRKYATPLLAYFDATGVTKRTGGLRTI